MAAEDDYKCQQRYTRVPTSLDLSDSTTEKNDQKKDRKEAKSWTCSGMLFKLFLLWGILNLLWGGCQLWTYYMPATSEYRPFVNSFEISVPDIMSSDTTWMKLGTPLFDPDGPPQKYDSFGSFRALSGDGSIVAISASRDDVGGNIVFGKGEGQVWLYG